MNRIGSVALLALLSVALPVFAHVTVAPTQSKLAATETYTFRVPSEGGRTTSSVTIPVPANVTIVSVAVPKEGGASYVRKTGQPDELVWSMNLPPNAAAMLVVTATNASAGASIDWKIQQKYTNGDVVNWTPSTKLEAGVK